MRKLYNAFSRYCIPNLVYHLRCLIRRNASVVDLGCGPSSPLRFVRKGRSLGVDAGKDAIAESKRQNIFSDYLVADITKHKFTQKFDVACAFDVLNMLDKKDSLKLLNKMEHMAKRVVVLVPNGVLAEPANMEAVAKSKYKTEFKYLRYRSSWTAKEMRRLGYKVIGINGLKLLRTSNAVPRIPIIGVLLSDFSQYFVQYFPSMAFHLLCYKDVK